MKKFENPSTTEQVFENLLEEAVYRLIYKSTPDPVRKAFCERDGREWPKDLKPGALILSLPDNERKLLEGLNPEVSGNHFRRFSSVI